MSEKNTHHSLVEQQFGEQANAYLTSTVHAQGQDLQKLASLLSADSNAHVLDIGCGAGHASFAVATNVHSVTSYDLSTDMLSTVRQGAEDRQLTNIHTACGIAESLPFDSSSFDIIISRYSAHHWHNVSLAMYEASRVLKTGGRIVLMDVVSPGNPVLDIYLQTVEVLRDRSHVRDYSIAEWSRFCNEAGLKIDEISTDRLQLEFTSWTQRMRTPQRYIDAIRAYQLEVSQEVKDYYHIAADGTFSTDIAMLVGHK